MTGGLAGSEQPLPASRHPGGDARRFEVTPAPPALTSGNTPQSTRSSRRTGAGDLPPTFVPFERLTPQLVVVDIDGQNPVENNARSRRRRLPSATGRSMHGLACTGSPPRHRRTAECAARRQPRSERLTVVAMTGVTAMVPAPRRRWTNGTALARRGHRPRTGPGRHHRHQQRGPLRRGLRDRPRPRQLGVLQQAGILGGLARHGGLSASPATYINDYGTRRARCARPLRPRLACRCMAAARTWQPLARRCLSSNGQPSRLSGRQRATAPLSAWATEFPPGSASST